jgi:S-adenosylmethionine uptake transporter
MSQIYSNKNLVGIVCVLGGTLALGVQDMIIKLVSGTYPLHEIGFVRSIFAIVLTCVFLKMEGGFSQLITKRPGAHLARGLLLICANMAYFLGLASMPLADAAAIFFSAPLMITLLAIPLLGEKVGPRRWVAVIIGMLGVVIMLRPDAGVIRLVGLLPLIAAVCYASIQILARKLGSTESASVMAFYVQICFVVFSIGFGLIFGSGWMSSGDNVTLDFLLRAWIWPDAFGFAMMAACGILVGIGGYLLSQAYRLAQARTVAPFEYAGLPFAVLLGFIVWGHLPDGMSMAGIALIAAGGLYVFYRENQESKKGTPVEPVLHD